VADPPRRAPKRRVAGVPPAAQPGIAPGR
jgi:hypothetical protein